MHYMQAHGYTAGPTQRPATAGALSAIVAVAAAYVIIDVTGAIHEVREHLHLPLHVAAGAYTVISLLEGVLYGRIFQRTVNDKHGGWLFGISYGFLLWMIGPVAILQWATNRPLVTGAAAGGLLAANLAYGLVLGLVYPWVHCLVQRRLYDVFREVQQKRPAFHEGKKALDLKRAPA